MKVASSLVHPLNELPVELRRASWFAVNRVKPVRNVSSRVPGGRTFQLSRMNRTETKMVPNGEARDQREIKILYLE